MFEIKMVIPPLHFAALCGHEARVACLLDQGAHKSTMNKHQLAPWQVAVGKRNLELVRILLEKGAKPSAPYLETNMSLETAITRGDTKIVVCFTTWS